MRKLFTILAVVMALVVGLAVHGFALDHPYTGGGPAGGGSLDDHPWGGDNNGGGGTNGTITERPRYSAITGYVVIDYFFSRMLTYSHGLRIWTKDIRPTRDVRDVRDVRAIRPQDSTNNSTYNGAE